MLTAAIQSLQSMREVRPREEEQRGGGQASGATLLAQRDGGCA